MDQILNKLHELQVDVSDTDLIYLKYLFDMGYKPVSEKEFNDAEDSLGNYESSRRYILMQRYHGMGHYQWLCFDPTKQTANKFYLEVVGGANGYDRIYNIDQFKLLTIEKEPVFLNLKNIAKLATVTTKHIWFSPTELNQIQDEVIDIYTDNNNNNDDYHNKNDNDYEDNYEDEYEDAYDYDDENDPNYLPSEDEDNNDDDY